MASVTVSHVNKSFGEFRALDDVSIEFADGGFYALLGPPAAARRPCYARSLASAFRTVAKF